MLKAVCLLFVATILFSCGNPKLLSRPIIDPPLFECAKTVEVKGFVPGAEIKIYANNALIGGGVSDSPEGQVFSVNPELTTGSTITAVQFFDGEESAASDTVIVVNALKFYGSDLPKPELNEPIYDCGGAIGARNLIKGGVLRVYANSAQVGIVNGCGEGQWLSVNPLFSEGQYIKADVEMCNNFSPMSDSVLVQQAPTSLPELEIDDIYENGTRCNIYNITNGAKVKVYNNGVLILEKNYSGGGQVCGLAPQVLPGDSITATQELCGVVSDPSDPSIVKPCSDLPAPTLGLICDGDASIKIIDSELGARIKIYRDGVLAADGGGNEVVLFTPAKSGENYSATQSLGNCISPISVAMAVGCDGPPTIMKPNIPYAGRAVAVGVDPKNDDRIMVASETGGLFRSLNRGKHWQHVSKSTTFRYTDVTYLDFQEDVIIAVAREDSREKSGGGIWRSKNNGTTWKRVELSTPSANCFNNIRANCISIDLERNRIWVGTSCGLAFSDNSGADWSFQPVVPGYSNDQVYSIETPDSTRIVIMTDAGIQVSKDGGATFSSVMGGLPTRWSRGSHNQIAIPPNDPDHIYFSAHYTPNGDSVNFRGLFWSVDYGATWDTIYKDEKGRNRSPFVRLSQPLSNQANAYDVYFSDGQGVFTRATAQTGNSGTISDWVDMVIDHADPADVGFEIDNKTPLLFLSDGGLHKTDDNGANWTLAGGGPAGYNALQITEVTGQFHQDGNSADLYFATQDNSIWASPDLGTTWPKNTCCEGFYLNIMRDYYPPAETDFSGVRCGACRNFITKPLIDGVVDFANPPQDNGNPRLLKPKNYIQNTFPFDSVGSLYRLTTNLGVDWDSSFLYLEETVSFPELSGPLNDPTIFTVFRAPLPRIAGNPALEIKRTTGVLTPGGPIMSDINGFGNLGIFATMFAWYEVFGVDPADPNYLIVPDMVDDSVKISTDGGITWEGDSLLTAAITSNGEFKFNWAQFSQVSCIEVNPDCPDNILVGTQQSGVFVTYNRGETWGRVFGSEKLPFVSSFFFAPDNVVIISTYGRGLWKMKVNCSKDGKKAGQQKKMNYSEPFALHNNSIIALSSIKEPSTMPNMKYVLVKDGSITDYKINPKTNQLMEVVISSGSLNMYNSKGEVVDPAFKVSFNKKPGLYSGNPYLSDYITKEVKVKGILLENTIVKAPLLARDDISRKDLPKQTEPKPYAAILNKKGGVSAVQDFAPIRVLVKNFNRNLALEVFVDGESVKLEKEPKLDGSGGTILSIPQNLEIGGHTVLVKQTGNNIVLQATTTFVKGTYD